MKRIRIMGLDLGTKRIGIALSDETRTLAQGKGYVERGDNDAVLKEISRLAEDNDVISIVVGYPINMNGTIGPRATDSEVFAKALRESTGLEVVLWDERLSTCEAEAVLIQADLSRAKRKTRIDSLSAQIILQSYLDNLVSGA